MSSPFERWVTGDIGRKLEENLRKATSLSRMLVDDADINPLDQPAGGDDRTDNTAHAIDFRSVKWYGTEYTFSPTQAACVKILWDHWERGTPTVGEQTILVEVDSSGDRMRDIFKTKQDAHPAWGTMIVSSGKGGFRLQEPQ